ADESFDAVVSFETIEHIEAQQAFLDQARRVLRSDGMLIVSCPNKHEYTDARDYINPYHVRELYRDEFSSLVASRFRFTSWFGQGLSFMSAIWPETAAGASDIFELSHADPFHELSGHSRPMYFIVVASNSEPTVDGIERRLSVLADREERLYRDYFKL